MQGKGRGSMEGKERESRFAVFCSTVYLFVSIGLLVIVCSVYCPQLGERVRTAVTGWDRSPVKAAFHTFADGLEQGQPVREAFSQTVEVLFP